MKKGWVKFGWDEQLTYAKSHLGQRINDWLAIWFLECVKISLKEVFWKVKVALKKYLKKVKVAFKKYLEKWKWKRVETSVVEVTN